MPVVSFIERKTSAKFQLDLEKKSLEYLENSTPTEPGFVPKELKTPLEKLLFHLSLGSCTGFLGPGMATTGTPG
ncbi:hypothetical protein H8959_019383 [Pygathrix nigripes]